MKKKLFVRVLAGVTAVSAITSLSACGNSTPEPTSTTTKPDINPYEGFTIPVVENNGDYFMWNSVEGATGYVVSIDGVTIGIGNPLKTVIEGVDVQTEGVEYKQCYYAIDRTALKEGVHIFKFAAYYENDGKRTISQWSNAFEIVISKPATPNVTANTKSLNVTTNASKINFEFINGEQVIKAHYFKQAGVNQVVVNVSDLIYEGTDKLVSGTLYKVKVTAESLGLISNPKELTMKYDVDPNDPVIALQGNTLQVTSQADKVEIKIDNKVTSFVVNTQNVNNIIINKDNFPGVNFVDGNIYIISASITVDGKEYSSKMLAYKYFDPEAIDAPLVAVNQNNQIVIFSSEIDLTFKFNNISATYKNYHPNQNAVIDLEDLNFGSAKLEDGKTYVLTVTARQNGEEFVSDPVTYVFHAEDLGTKIAKPAVVPADDPVFNFEKSLNNPVLLVKVGSNEYTVSLDGDIQQFNLKEYMENVNSKESIAIRKFLVENKDVKVSIKVLYTSDANELESDMSDVVTYNYESDLSDLIKLAYIAEIENDNSMVTITDTSSNYYFADSSYVRVVLNGKEVPVYTKVIGADNTIILFSLEDNIAFGENKLEVIAGLDNVNSFEVITSKYFTVFPKVDSLRIEGSEITWDLAEYATGYKVVVQANDNNSLPEEFLIDEEMGLVFDTREYKGSNNFTVKVFAMIGNTVSETSTELSVKRINSQITLEDKGASLLFKSESNKYDVGVDVVVDDVVVGSILFDHNAINPAQILNKTLLFDNIPSGQFILRAYIKGNNIDYVDSPYEEYAFKLTNNLSYTFVEGTKVKVNTEETKLYINSDVADSEDEIELAQDKAFDLIDGYVNELEGVATYVTISEIVDEFSKTAVNEIKRPRTIVLAENRVADVIAFKDYDNDTLIVAWNEIYLASYDVVIIGPNEKKCGSFVVDNTKNAKFNISDYLTDGFGYYEVMVRVHGNGDLLSGVYSKCLFAYYDIDEEIETQNIKFAHDYKVDSYTTLEVKKSLNRHLVLYYNWDEVEEEYLSQKNFTVTEDDPLNPDPDLDLTVDTLLMNMYLNGSTKVMISAEVNNLLGLPMYKNYSIKVQKELDLYELRVGYMSAPNQDRVYYSMANDFDEHLYLPEINYEKLNAIHKSVDEDNNHIITYETIYYGYTYQKVNYVNLGLYTVKNGVSTAGVKYKVENLFVREDNLAEDLEEVTLEHVIVPDNVDLFTYLSKYLKLEDGMSYYYDTNLWQKLEDNSKELSHKPALNIYVSDTNYYITLKGNNAQDIPATNKNVISSNEVVLKYKANADHNITFEPTLDHYEFVGWFTLDGKEYEAGKLNANVTYYAKFSEITHTLTINNLKGKNNVLVTMDPNYEFGQAISGVCKDGDTIDFIVPFRRDGYVFAGYTTDKAGENKFDFNDAEVSEDLTLYAQWVKEKDNSYVEMMNTNAHKTLGTADQVNLYETTDEKAAYVYILVQKDVTDAKIFLGSLSETGVISDEAKYAFNYVVTNLTTNQAIGSGKAQSTDYYSLTLSAKAGDLIEIKLVGGYDALGKAGIYVEGFEPAGPITIKFEGKLEYDAEANLVLTYNESTALQFNLTPEKEGAAFSKYVNHETSADFDLATVHNLDDDIVLDVVWA